MVRRGASGEPVCRTTWIGVVSRTTPGQSAEAGRDGWHRESRWNPGYGRRDSVLMRVLAFSGGKDSMACLHLMRGSLDCAIYIDTGKAYPETLELVRYAGSIVP
ncbi:MAG: phosphoadenosine phosphosulfate reductase family protein, partial [Betaproteobacteria bacterium]|nr:phosphoadenosine phosphosulfate reductase family protein [Betaproteobacteria bacterium]